MQGKETFESIPKSGLFEAPDDEELTVVFNEERNSSYLGALVDFDIYEFPLKLEKEDLRRVPSAKKWEGKQVKTYLWKLNVGKLEEWRMEPEIYMENSRYAVVPLNPESLKVEGYEKKTDRCLKLAREFRREGEKIEVALAVKKRRGRLPAKYREIRKIKASSQSKAIKLAVEEMGKLCVLANATEGESV